MHDDMRHKHNPFWHHAFCFVRWGLIYFMIGLLLGFGVLIHYLVGSNYNNSDAFLSNITLWFGSPLMLSSSYLQIGGLGMAILGGLCILIYRCNSDTLHPPTDRRAGLILCNIGMIALFITGYIGYFVFDYAWPGFYYTPIQEGKNWWLILQGLSLVVYFIGVVFAFVCLCKCKRSYCCETHDRVPNTNPNRVNP